MKRTPGTLPNTGRVFSITIPDHEQWFADFFGVLLDLFDAWEWEEYDGLTVDETVTAWRAALQDLEFTDGIPE